MAATEVGATTLCGDEGGGIGEENGGKNYPSLLTLRVIMHGREAGSIIGKRGENVKKFREETGARINISDATSPERIVTVTGSLDQIVATFRMVCWRFEEDLQQLNAALGGSEMSKHLVGLRLILPAIQCGSVIGRSGAKVKEIRDNSGASVQISGDLLPNSTERLVTVSGSVDAVIKAVEMICGVILECPIKGPVSQYRPKPTRPVSLILPMQYEASHHAGQYQLPGMSYPQVFNPLSYPTLIASQQTIVALPYSALPPGTLLQPLPSSFPQVNGAQALTSAVGQSTQPTQILTIPNELIGCIIGRGGAKINEIRQQSGANIKISSSDDRSSERVIAITGAQESVISAIQLIELSLEAHKATMFGSGIRHSRSNSSISLFQPTNHQSAADNSKLNETVEAVMTSPQSESKISHHLPRPHNAGGGDLSQRPPNSSSIFQSSQGFHQPPTFQQNLNNAPSYILPLSHVQPLIQPLLTQKGIRGHLTDCTAMASNGVEGSQTEPYQAANQQTFQGGTLIAAGSHPGQHLFNPNLYHVQTSSAIQIAFRPLNIAGSIMDSQLLEANNGNLMMIETPSGATMASPDGSNCLIEPTRMLGLKSKNNNGCGGYVLTTGSRGGFKFAPY